jgi:hypothetical protein
MSSGLKLNSDSNGAIFMKIRRIPSELRLEVASAPFSFGQPIPAKFEATV